MTRSPDAPTLACNCPESGTSGSCPFHDYSTVRPSPDAQPTPRTEAGRDALSFLLTDVWRASILAIEREAADAVALDPVDAFLEAAVDRIEDWVRAGGPIRTALHSEKLRVVRSEGTPDR